IVYQTHLPKHKVPYYVWLQYCFVDHYLSDVVPFNAQNSRWFIADEQLFVLLNFCPEFVDEKPQLYGLASPVQLHLPTDRVVQDRGLLICVGNNECGSIVLGRTEHVVFDLDPIACGDSKQCTFEQATGNPYISTFRDNDCLTVYRLV